MSDLPDEWVNVQGKVVPLDEGNLQSCGYEGPIQSLLSEHPRLRMYTANCVKIGAGRLSDASMTPEGRIYAGYCRGGSGNNYYLSTEATPNAPADE